MRRLLAPLSVVALAIALVALLVFGVLRTADDTSIDQAIADGRPPQAHDASLPLLDGSGARTLTDYRGADGRFVIVNFFASWCSPCKEEAPMLNRLQTQLGDRATVVGVAWNDTIERSRRFVREQDVAFPVLRDVDGAFAREYGVAALPETFVIDPRGRIVALKRSVLTDEWIDSELDPLLAARRKVA